MASVGVVVIVCWCREAQLVDPFVRSFVVLTFERFARTTSKQHACTRIRGCNTGRLTVFIRRVVCIT